DRLAAFHQFAPCQVAPIAHHADTATGLARQDGADFDPIQPGLHDRGGLFLRDLFVGADDELARDRVAHVFRRDAAEDALPQLLDDLAALHHGSVVDDVLSAAIILCYVYVLRHIHAVSCHYTGHL